MTIEAMRQALEALKTASANTQVAQERLLHEAAIKRLRNAIDESETMQTHSEDCWKWHHACAVATVLRLKAGVETLDSLYKKAYQLRDELMELRKAEIERERTK